MRDVATKLYQNSSLYEEPKSQIGNVNIVYNNLEDDKETKIDAAVGNITQELKGNVEDYLSDRKSY